MTEQRLSICFVLTSPFALNAFLLQHLSALSDSYAIVVCVNSAASPISKNLDPRIEVIHVNITRQIDLKRDVLALLALIKLMRKRRFDAVHSVTPKGGLLAMLAAWLTRIQVRTHTFTGQVWATRRGVSRVVLRFMDKVLTICATDVFADSPSQARFLESEGVCATGRVKVFGAGSISGVDVVRFSSIPGRKTRIRKALGIPEDAPVFLFLGRIQCDKGVLVLAQAFQRLAQEHSSAHMLWVGPDEDNLTSMVKNTAIGRSHVTGLTSTPEDYLDAADVLVLPSFREGFGSVIIEGAAMGLPAVASRIYGLTDAVIDGETGILCAPGDVDELFTAMTKMLPSENRQRMGNLALKRATSQFSSDSLTQLWVDYYRDKFSD